MDQNNFGTVENLIENDERGKEFELCCLKKCGNNLSRVDGEIRDKYHKVSVTIENMNWIHNLDLVRTYHIEIIEGEKESKGSGRYLFHIKKSCISPPLLNPKHQTSKEYVSLNRNIKKTIPELFMTSPLNIIKKIKQNVNFHEKVELEVRGIQLPKWGTFECELFDRDDTINAEIFYKGGSGRIIFNRYKLNENRDKIFIVEYEWSNKNVEELPNQIREGQLPNQIREQQIPNQIREQQIPNIVQEENEEFNSPIERYFELPNNEEETHQEFRPLPKIFHDSISSRCLSELKITQYRAFEKINELSAKTQLKRETKSKENKEEFKILSDWSLNLLLIDKRYVESLSKGKTIKLLTLHFYIAGKNKDEEIIREMKVKVVLFGDLAEKKYHLLKCGKFYEIYNGKLKDMYKSNFKEDPNDNLSLLGEYWFQINIRYPNVDATEISRSQVQQMEE